MQYKESSPEEPPKVEFTRFDYLICTICFHDYNSCHLPEHEIKIRLNRYLFPAATWDKQCSKLSGGEKMRLSFCCLMISNHTPDLFILDEPTNNLDIRSIEIITSTLKSYAGTVLIVSHDHTFIEETGIEKCIRL